MGFGFHKVVSGPWYQRIGLMDISFLRGHVGNVQGRLVINTSLIGGAARIILLYLFGKSVVVATV